MQLNSDDLLAKIRQDWPTEFELSRLQLLTEVQDREITRLNGLLPPASYSATSPRPYVLPVGEQEEPRV
jgi:hypothetical protein